MRKFLFVLFIGFFALPCSAQEVDPQVRVVFFTPLDLNDNWFLTNWVVANLKSVPNINIFPGFGYRRNNWWIALTTQRQWSSAGNQWMIDFRYQTAFNNRWVISLEGEPFLTKKAFYEFLIINFRIYKQLSIGAESENVHKPGPDIVDVGPRISLPIANLGKYQLALAAAYQIHYKSADIPRLYIVLNRRFKK